MQFIFQPLTAANWDDFEELFGPRGACGGCWCMNWRLNSADYNKLKGGGNKEAMKKIAERSPPGIIAYDDQLPVGWCAVAPRKEYVRLESSRVLKPVDEKEVWSVSCFFIKKDYRRKGLSTLLLREAVNFAFKKGAIIVEGYPVEQKNDSKMPDVFVWTGLPVTFIKAGFTEVIRRSENRPIMRRYKK
ncbi:MAG: GNAT family N-acetyltransferase [Ferruginibacter sp.]